MWKATLFISYTYGKEQILKDRYTISSYILAIILTFDQSVLQLG